SWLSGSLKLYREIGRNPAPTGDTAPPPADWMSEIPAAPLSSGGRAEAADAPPDAAPPAAEADVRFVTLPLPGGASQELAVVPSDVEAAVTTAILPQA